MSVEYLLNDVNKLEAKRITGVDGVSECTGLGIAKPKRLERCFNCFERGHHIKQCPKSSTTKKCYVCREEGHVKSQCPLRIKQKETKSKRQKTESVEKSVAIKLSEEESHSKELT